ncbi:MAG: thiosulfate oxidation carrier protein SoxY [Candidatus Rokubacteria bacterium]|nr:thiosulfate oxidation carrier protein SoxY [Candidatus Rokubacteria bacterium]MBI2492579.1 thiosulfate oxidation carrier protein SoxY [Candidatus Rokubacteria bacterium]MBI4629862.1 thiosulfate oxidation carrier protein SoxY [Candidatus Rokubacteria bacterium]
MEKTSSTSRITRRTLLRALAVAGLGGAAGPLLGPGAITAQGTLGALQPEEKVEATMKRLFGGRPIKDGSGAIKIDMPLIAENGAVVPITVEVQSPMTPTNYVKHIYIISDKNRRPMNARFTLTPAMGTALVGANVRLGETTDVRAVAELSDGSLLMAKREVKVTVGGCGG